MKAAPSTPGVVMGSLKIFRKSVEKNTKNTNEMHLNQYSYIILTYLPHEAVAEVSKDKGPIGRGCGEFNWFESQLMSDSMEVRFK